MLYHAQDAMHITVSTTCKESSQGKFNRLVGILTSDKDLKTRMRGTFGNYLALMGHMHVTKVSQPLITAIKEHLLYMMDREIMINNSSFI